MSIINHPQAGINHKTQLAGLSRCIERTEKRLAACTGRQRAREIRDRIARLESLRARIVEGASIEVAAECAA